MMVMKVSGFLIVQVDGAVDFVKNRPNSRPNAVFVPVHLEVADELFKTPTTPTVRMTVTERDLPMLSVIDQHVAAIERAGVKVEIDNK